MSCEDGICDPIQALYKIDELLKEWNESGKMGDLVLITKIQEIVGNII